MTRVFVAIMGAIVAIAAMSSPADARSRHRRGEEGQVISLLKEQARQIEKMRSELEDIRRRLHPDEVAEAKPPAAAPTNPLIGKAIMPVPDSGGLAEYARHIARSTKLSDLTPGLAVKAAEILRSCSTRLVSGYRRGARVAGSGRPSLHSIYPSEAVDLAGDPGCIYSHLRGWKGGYSTDYLAVRHVHVSLSSGGRERGARFVHYRGGNRFARYVGRGTPRHARHRPAYRAYAQADAASYYRPHRVR